MSTFTYRLRRESFRKPSKNERQYFHRRAFEERRAQARERAEAREHEERERLRALHRDRCPRCGEPLEHVRIRDLWADQCPVCEGVWLDREVFRTLTHEKEQPLAAMFRYMLVDQAMGDIDPR
jgi:hypothetical protein